MSFRSHGRILLTYHAELIFIIASCKYIINIFGNMETLDRLINQISEEIDVSSKRIIQRGFSGQSRLEPAKPDLLSRSEKKKRSRVIRESTAGAKWFDLPTKEVELEDKLTLDAIRLRETLNPGKFYKKRATDKVSKHFQIGTIIEHPIDYYSSRATRKEQKQTLVDELIADAEFKKNVKKRYNRLRATNAIKKREKALADRRKVLQGKKKKKPSKEQ